MRIRCNARARQASQYRKRADTPRPQGWHFVGGPGGGAGGDVELGLLAVLPVEPPYAWHFHGCPPARRFASGAAPLQPRPDPAAPPPRLMSCTWQPCKNPPGGRDSKSNSTRGLLPLLCAGNSIAISLRRKGQHHSPAAASSSFICPSAACSCHARCAAFDQGLAWPPQPCPPSRWLLPPVPCIHGGCHSHASSGTPNHQASTAAPNSSSAAALA